jgi:hypothetical protein
LERHGRLGHRLWCVDATIIRASRAAGGARKVPEVLPRLETLSQAPRLWVG